MKLTQIPEGMVIDIQAVGTTLNVELERKIFSMIGRFRQYFAKINAVHFHIIQSTQKAALPRTVNVRLGIAGEDVFASDSGNNLMKILGGLEQKIVQQLRKRKIG
jgi:ribosome-associated translation inhibitor RaiA